MNMLSFDIAIKTWHFAASGLEALKQCANQILCKAVCDTVAMEAIRTRS